VGAIAALASMVEEIAVGRDWVVAITDGDREARTGTPLRLLLPPSLFSSHQMDRHNSRQRDRDADQPLLQGRCARGLLARHGLHLAQYVLPIFLFFLLLLLLLLLFFSHLIIQMI
jgi:hypothetical protein